MPFTLRVNELPPLAEILQVPQIVLVDETGPTAFLGLGAGIALLVGEFTKGSFVPTEVTSPGELASLYGDSVYKYFSQSAGGVQDGSQAAYNGNGMLQLLGKKFKRLGICRVDTEMVTTDGGTTKGALTVTVTVAAADQAAGVTNKAIKIKAGTRFADQAIATATIIVAVSGDVTIPAGTAVTSNTVTVSVPCFPVRVVEPVVATAIGAVDTVIDPVIENVASTTLISSVTNATALWPSGTGTSLATRIEGRYSPAIDKTMPGSDVTDEVTIIWAARRTSVIRLALSNNAAAASQVGRDRIACVAAEPSAGPSTSQASAAKSAAASLASSDGYVQPADHTVTAFPHTKVLVPDFGNTKVLINPDGWLACTLSNFPEEYNPGQENPFIQGIVELEDAYIENPLSKQDYANLKAGGVCGIQHDRTVGWWFVDGVTAANKTTYPTRVPIKRRRVAGMIQDGLAVLAAPYNKKPATNERVGAFVTAIESYLTSLLSPEQPSLQRIAAFAVDPNGGNTDDLVALGIYTVLVYVRVLPTMDVILLRTKIGETVEIPAQAPAAA